jgi:uncharacterized protein (TIGR03435 family)
MRRSALLFFGTLLLSAETPDRFEVAVIRPTEAGPGTGTSFNLFEGGRLKITNEPVRLLIRVAYQLQNIQIVGAPSWVDSDGYDIEAKTAARGKIPQGQVSPLMQNLLAERFNLKFHHETRDLSVYALVTAKDGPKLKRSAEGESSGMNSSGGARGSHLKATATSMLLLANYIGNRLGRIVVDKTMLDGGYDFSLDWTPDETPDSSSPSLVTALRDQLGLRLETQKSPVEVVVIDHIERPSEN